MLEEAMTPTPDPLREAVLRLLAEHDEDNRRQPSFVTIEMLRAALAAQPAPPLDVRRVVKAIENVAARHGIKKAQPLAGDLARIYGYSTTIADMDAQIAAEYARLAEPKP